MTWPARTIDPMIAPFGTPRSRSAVGGNPGRHAQLDDLRLPFLQHREQAGASSVDLVNDRRDRRTARRQRHVDPDTLEQP